MRREDLYAEDDFAKIIRLRAWGLMPDGKQRVTAVLLAEVSTPLHDRRSRLGEIE